MNNECENLLPSNTIHRTTVQSGTGSSRTFRLADMDDTRAVDFSVNKIELINYYDAEVHNSPYPGIIEQKFTYYVQNKSNFTRKVRVAVNESSDPVSI